MKRLPISVCLIVKNEESYLDACLKSVKDWVNEIIVVDTGSTDKTVEIAKDNGAKVSHFEWIGDFAAARNESIKHAKNPLILQLDADEEIIQKSIPWFEKEYPYNNFDGYYLPLHNLRDASSEEILLTHRLIRFYKNHPQIRYQFKIHENIIIPSGRVALSEAEILHKGYGKEVNNENKSKRNLELLLNNIRDKPNDPISHFYASQSFSAMGKSLDAYKACQKALRLGVTYPVKAHVYRMLFSYITDHKLVNDFSKIEKTIPNDDLFPEINFYRALLFQRLGEKEAARNFYLQFEEVCENPPGNRKVGDEDFIVLPNYVSTLSNLALMAHEENKVQLALDYFYKALELSPMSSHLYSMIARSEMMLNKKVEAVLVLEKAVDIFEKQYINLHQKELITQYKEMITKIRES